MLYLGRILWTCCFCSSLFIACTATSIVMTMMIRDEAVNLKSNLPMWLPFIDYFVFIVDDRTSDSSVQTIENVIKDKSRFKIFPYEFTGFGPARTLSLKHVS